MTSNRLGFNNLPAWHQKMISCLLNVSFPGNPEISRQLKTAEFEVIDANRSLRICPSILVNAPVEKTIPVEASALDTDGIPIEVLLFTRRGVVNMLEILRGDGRTVKEMPSVDQFKVMVLAP
jgi:hypothetical protein